MYPCLVTDNLQKIKVHDLINICFVEYTFSKSSGEYEVDRLRTFPYVDFDLPYLEGKFRNEEDTLTIDAVYFQSTEKLLIERKLGVSKLRFVNCVFATSPHFAFPHDEVSFDNCVFQTGLSSLGGVKAYDFLCCLAPEMRFYGKRQSVGIDRCRCSMLSFESLDAHELTLRETAFESVSLFGTHIHNVSEFDVVGAFGVPSNSSNYRRRLEDGLDSVRKYRHGITTFEEFYTELQMFRTISNAELSKSAASSLDYILESNRPRDSKALMLLFRMFGQFILFDRVLVLSLATCGILCGPILIFHAIGDSNLTGYSQIEIVQDFVTAFMIKPSDKFAEAFPIVATAISLLGKFFLGAITFTFSRRYL